MLAHADSFSPASSGISDERVTHGGGAAAYSRGMRRGVIALLSSLWLAASGPAAVFAAPPPVAAPAVVGNALLPALLAGGESVTTGPGGHVLTMGTDGDLVLVRPDGNRLWHSDTAGQPGARLEFGADGELALRSTTGTPIWFAGTAGSPGARAWLQADGNLVVYAASGLPLWDSAGHLGKPGTWVQRVPQRLPPGALTLSSNGRFRLASQRDGNVVLYDAGRPVWHLGTWDRPGAWPVVQDDGNLVVYSAAGAPVWYTGTRGHSGVRLLVQDDGNVVLYEGDVPLWDSQGWTPRHATFVGSVGHQLRAGETILSPSGGIRAVLEDSGDIVVYAASGPIWSSRVGAGPRAVLTLEAGNAVLRSADGSWRWSSGTSDAAFLHMQADTNLVLYNAAGTPRWDQLAYLRHWPTVARTPVVPTGNLLTAGWNGGRVKLVQRKVGLVRTGSGVTMDAQTMAAVAAWQSRHGGLRTDGVVDRATWDAMALGWPFDIDGWMPPVAIGPGATPSQRTEQLVAFALAQVGAAYTWGGAGPSQLGYDCSGLVLAGLYSAGLDPYPMTVIAHQGPAYNTAAHFYGDPRYLTVAASQMRRGDLVFYANASGTITHMAIYLGGGQVVEATGSAVRVRAVSTSVGATRLAYVKRPFV